MVESTIETTTTKQNNFMEEWLSWFKAPHLKCDVDASSPWVRILPLPPFYGGVSVTAAR